jgi:hypothetical protein
VEGESTSGSCNTSRNNYIGLSVVQVRMANPGCLADGCPNVHPTNLDSVLALVYLLNRTRPPGAEKNENRQFWNGWERDFWTSCLQDSR